MTKNRCFVCGSFNFRADRALSGRLICTSCGNPYGVKKYVRNRIYKDNFPKIKTKNFLFITLFIFVFFLIIV